MEFELWCQACGCRADFTAIASASEHDTQFYLRCYQCGQKYCALVAFLQEQVVFYWRAKMNTVYLPFVRGEASRELDYLPHCFNAEMAKRAAGRAAGNRCEFGYDKVEYRGQVAGRAQYGPRLSRWSTEKHPPGQAIWVPSPPFISKTFGR